jgi:hypothetical protein
MVTKMKKTKCMGTSKNKRVMSGGGGGKGRVSRYTKKFRKCYENFLKILESNSNDIKNDDTKIRKMEEWGRLRGIYTYLKSKKLEGDEKTFLEKMEENLKEKYGNYTGAISCFENDSDSTILLEKGCVLEKDYVNSKKDADIPIVKTKKAQEEAENIKVETPNEEETQRAEEQTENTREEVRKAQEEAETAREEEEEEEEEKEEEGTQRATAASSTIEGDDQSEAPVSDAPAEETPATVAEVSNDAVGQPRTDDAKAKGMNADDEAVDEAPAPDALSTIEGNVQSETSVQSNPVGDAGNDNGDSFDPYANIKVVKGDGQGGGRSKRRQKSSRRRRGKSMKSKKGRKTRRR